MPDVDAFGGVEPTIESSLSLPENQLSSGLNKVGGVALLAVGIDFSRLSVDSLKQLRCCDVAYMAASENIRRLGVVLEVIRSAPAAVKSEWYSNTCGVPPDTSFFGKVIQYLTTLRSDNVG